MQLKGGETERESKGRAYEEEKLDEQNLLFVNISITENAEIKSTIIYLVKVSNCHS